MNISPNLSFGVSNNQNKIDAALKTWEKVSENLAKKESLENLTIEETSNLIRCYYHINFKPAAKKG